MEIIEWNFENFLWLNCLVRTEGSNSEMQKLFQCGSAAFGTGNPTTCLHAGCVYIGRFVCVLYFVREVNSLWLLSCSWRLVHTNTNISTSAHMPSTRYIRAAVVSRVYSMHGWYAVTHVHSFDCFSLFFSFVWLPCSSDHKSTRTQTVVYVLWFGVFFSLALCARVCVCVCVSARIRFRIFSTHGISPCSTLFAVWFFSCLCSLFRSFVLSQ